MAQAVTWRTLATSPPLSCCCCFYAASAYGSWGGCSLKACHLRSEIRSQYWCVHYCTSIYSYGNTHSDHMEHRNAPEKLRAYGGIYPIKEHIALPLCSQDRNIFLPATCAFFCECISDLAERPSTANHPASGTPTT